METRLTIIGGIITGEAARMMTGSLGVALVTALLTGACAYLGQRAARYLWAKAKKELDYIIIKFKKK